MCRFRLVFGVFVAIVCAGLTAATIENEALTRRIVLAIWEASQVSAAMDAENARIFVRMYVASIVERIDRGEESYAVLAQELVRFNACLESGFVPQNCETYKYDSR